MVSQAHRQNEQTFKCFASAHCSNDAKAAGAGGGFKSKETRRTRRGNEDIFRQTQQMREAANTCSNLSSDGLIHLKVWVSLTVQ